MISEWPDDHLKQAEAAVMRSFPRLPANEVIDAIATAAETMPIGEGVLTLSDRAIAIVAARLAETESAAESAAAAAEAAEETATP